MVKEFGTTKTHFINQSGKLQLTTLAQQNNKLQLWDNNPIIKSSKLQLWDNNPIKSSKLQLWNMKPFYRVLQNDNSKIKLRSKDHS